MESFSVKAYLQATDNNFVKTFNDAAKQVENFQKNTNSTMSAVGKVMTSSGKAMTKMVTLPIVGMGVAAAKVGGDFEEQMSRVKAISGATGKSFDLLRQQAIDLGAKTAFSAKESAAGMENLASAGFDANEIMKAMPGLLDLAAVSGGDVALASENAATALRGFGLDASQAGHVADVFARAAADTNAEVADMGEAMKYIAPVANAMGLSIEEVAAAIGIMSDAGIKGSQAGTSLRGALSRLAKPTKPMIGVMNDLGISFYDAEGKMKPLKEQIGMLKEAFKGLTPEEQQHALVTLYGQEALSGMMALIDKGPEKLGTLTKSLKDSDGAADKMARTMQDNMNSSLEQMMGALESAAIVIQKIIAPYVRKFADAVAGLVEKFVSAPEPVQKLVVVLGLIAAAIGPALLIIGTTIIKLQQFRVALMILKSDIPKLGKALSAVGGVFKSFFGLLVANPIILVVVAIAALVAGFIYLWNTSEAFRNFWIGLWENIKKAVDSAIKGIQSGWNATKKWFSDLWNGIKNGAKGLWDGTIQGAKDAVDSVKNTWNGIKEWFSNLWKGATSGLSSAWDSVTTTLAPFIETIKSIFQPMLEFFSGLWEQVKTIFTAAWEVIKTIVMGPVLLIIDLITGNFNQFKEDFAMLWQTLATAIQTIVQTFVNIVVGFYKSFFQTVVNIWNAIVDGVKSLWSSFTTWVVDTTKTIVDGIVNGWNSFKQGTINLWNATVQWIKDTWNNFKQWIKTTVDNLVNGVKQGWENLKQGTVDIFNGLVNGAKQAWQKLKDSVDNVVQSVRDIFDTLRNIDLLDIGRAIIDGFVKGLKSAWEAGMKFISGIGDWIREHKGPIRVDRKLLIPAGNAIMGGLNKGLNNSFKTVQNSVLGMNDFLANAINAGGSVNIGANIRNANNSIGGTIAHEVNLNKGKQPAQINIRLGKQEFKAFVEDISQAQGWEAATNNLY